MERTPAAAEARLLAAIGRMELLLAPNARPSARDRVVIELGPAEARRILRAIRRAQAAVVEPGLDSLVA